MSLEINSRPTLVVLFNMRCDVRLLRSLKLSLLEKPHRPAA